MGQWYECYPREGEKLTIQHVAGDVVIERRLWDPYRKRFWKVEEETVPQGDVLGTLVYDFGIEHEDALALEAPFMPEKVA